MQIYKSFSIGSNNITCLVVAPLICDDNIWVCGAFADCVFWWAGGKLCVCAEKDGCDRIWEELTPTNREPCVVSRSINCFKHWKSPRLDWICRSFSVGLVLWKQKNEIPDLIDFQIICFKKYFNKICSRSCDIFRLTVRVIEDDTLMLIWKKTYYFFEKEFVKK